MLSKILGYASPIESAATAAAIPTCGTAPLSPPKPDTGGGVKQFLLDETTNDINMTLIMTGNTASVSGGPPPTTDDMVCISDEEDENEMIEDGYSPNYKIDAKRAKTSTTLFRVAPLHLGDR